MYMCYGHSPVYLSLTVHIVMLLFVLIVFCYFDNSVITHDLRKSRVCSSLTQILPFQGVYICS